MYLFFDTETTGLPRNYRALVTDLDNWPRMVQIAWLAADPQGRVLSESTHIIRPDGFQIPAESARIHGISQARALAAGEALPAVLQAFAQAVAAADFVVGHNVTFDEKIVGAEFLRTGIDHVLWHRERICTKVEATDFCQLPGNYGYKWPTLDELHRKLFGKTFPNAHDALGDVRATQQCFFELKRLEVI